MENWLSSLSAVGGMAKKTIEAYRHDVSHFIHFISNHYGKRSSKAVLSKVNVKDMRSWISHARSSGLSPRSLARALSAIKSFYRWLGQTYGISTTAVLSTRTPKFEKPLPRPVKKSDAKNLINQIDIDQTPLPDILNIIGKGNKERIIPVLPIAQSAVKKYLKECPYSFLPGDYLFKGARGGPLNQRIIRKVMEQTRIQLGLPSTCLFIKKHTLKHN